MAASVNRVILLGVLLGRLGKDLEQRFTSSGVAFTRFSLATDETWKDSGGKKREHVEWHNIITWRKLADICAQYLSKGRLVYLEGRLQTRSWQDKDGNKRSVAEVLADQMVMLPRGSSSDGHRADEGKGVRSEPAAAAAAGDDDIPF